MVRKKKKKEEIIGKRCLRIQEGKASLVQNVVEGVGDDREGEGMVSDEQAMQVNEEELLAGVRSVINEVKEIIAMDESIDGIFSKRLIGED